MTGLLYTAVSKWSDEETPAHHQDNRSRRHDRDPVRAAALRPFDANGELGHDRPPSRSGLYIRHNCGELAEMAPFFTRRLRRDRPLAEFRRDLDGGLSRRRAHGSSGEEVG